MWPTGCHMRTMRAAASGAHTSIIILVLGIISLHVQAYIPKNSSMSDQQGGSPIFLVISRTILDGSPIFLVISGNILRATDEINLRYFL